MYRFYVQGELCEGPIVIMDPGIAHQVRSVFRIKSGEEIILFGGSSYIDAGWDFVFRVEKIKETSLGGEIIRKVKNDRDPRILLTLHQSVLKKDKMEWVFEKCTEVGVGYFVPIISERSIKTSINDTRARKIIKEASEQSGRSVMPRLGQVLSFKDAVQALRKENSLNILAHEGDVQKKIEGLPLMRSGDINLFIGPEGGFSQKEVWFAENAGFFIISLSRRVLRAETAAIVGSYAVLHRFGN